jgi:large subunit ribosomal protein L10
MAKSKQQKQEIIDFYKKNLEESNGVIFTNNPGLKGNDVVTLKKKLSEVNAHFHIIKNRLFKLAIKDKIDENMFAGATTAIFSQGEITEAAKAFKDFSKTTVEKPEIKGGLIGELLISEDRAKLLAELPSKNELLSKTVYMFNAPLSGFAQTLIGVQRNFVYALNAVKEKKTN